MAVADDVAALYTSVLGRAPDAEGLAYFTDAINRGGTLEQVRQALATSPESQANVQNIFTQNLQRPATAADVQYFTNAIAGGGLLSDARRDIAASTEAKGLPSMHSLPHKLDRLWVLRRCRVSLGAIQPQPR